MLKDEVFQLIGAPIVKDSLEGFNASLISYGEVLYLYFHFSPFETVSQFMMIFFFYPVLDWKWENIHHVGSP